jgi:hypothetical protein
MLLFAGNRAHRGLPWRSRPWAAAARTRRAVAERRMAAGPLFCLAMQSPGVAQRDSNFKSSPGRRKIAAPPPLRAAAAHGTERPLGRPPARSPGGKAYVVSGGAMMLALAGHHPPIHSVISQRDVMKCCASSGASCTRKLARSSARPSSRRSSLKSPKRGESVIASIPAALARSVKLATAR